MGKAAEKKQEEKKEQTPKDILKAMGRSSWDVDPWKKVYSNAPKNEEGKAEIMSQFFSEVNQDDWGVWTCDYNYDDDNTVLWMTGNLCEGFCARMDQIRKWSFGTVQLLQVPGTEGGKGNIKLRGCFVMRDPTQGADQIVKSNPDAEYWTWTKVDLNTEAGRNVVTERWSKIYEGNTTSDGLNVYDAWEMK